MTSFIPIHRNQRPYEANQAAVIGSKILAKSILDCGDHYQIIVVFELSTRMEFYWIFKARSARSARRNWRFVGFQPRKESFEAFTCIYGRLHDGATLRQKIAHKRAFKAISIKPVHNSIFAAWDTTPGIQTFDLIRKKFENGRKGRMAMMYR
jgi:hypothetical protein